MSKQSKQQAAALKHGWRSGLEESVCLQLEELGRGFEFEPFAITFVQPVKLRKYTPDIVLPNGIVIETKGRFITSDRQKHLLVKEQYPDLDLRFVFSNSRQRISKQSKTTYAKWCTLKGFLFADAKNILEWLSWVDEPRNTASLRVIRKIERGDR